MDPVKTESPVSTIPSPDSAETSVISPVTATDSPEALDLVSVSETSALPNPTASPVPPLTPEPAIPASTPSAGWRLRKGEDGTVFGPIDAATLKEWANAAQVAPIDEVDNGDDKWVAAPTVSFLEMVWEVRLTEAETYGPTTTGTLKEFLQDGLINDSTLVTHVNSKQHMAVGVLLAHPDMVAPPLPVGASREIKSGAHLPDTSFSDTAKLNLVDLAKDQRIRQLEEDLRVLKKEHDDLLQKFRQLNQELISVKNRA
jgi:hypothetical protein